MTSPPGGGSEYIADHEHSAYEQGKQEYAGASNVPIIGDVLTDVLSKAKATAEASKYGQEQAKALSVDQELREKPGSLGNTHYLSFEHKEMDRFVRENFDPAAVHDVGRVYHGHGAKFLEFAEQIRQAATKTEHTWQGEAGDAMRKHVTQLADHMSHSGSAAQLTANQVGMQAEAAERARNSMPEVVEFDMKQELKNYFSDPNPFTALSRANDIVEKQEKSQAAHAEAAQVMSKMETNFGTAAAQTPAFVPAPRGPEEQPGTSEPSQNTIGSINPSSTPASTQSAWSSPNTSTPQYSPPSAPNIPPSSTNAVWQQSPPATPPSDTRWNPNTGQWERQNPYNGRWAPLPPNQQRPGPGGPGGGRPGGAGGMGGGRGGGMGGAGRVGGGQLGAGGRAGIGGLGAAGGAGAGGAGAGGRGGAGMAGGGGAGRGQGGKSEEDDEHESKYVVDTDEAWDDLGLPKVAPPVFGE